MTLQGKLNRRTFLKASAATALGASALSSVHWSGAQTVKELTANPMLHLVNRATWGARPQDLRKAADMGAEAYLEWQLNHEAIADPIIDTFLAEQPTLSMSYDELKQELDNGGDYGDVLRTAWWGRLYRAIYSEKQLYEKIVEFWTDHFNVPIPDYLTEKIVEDREVIRRHALGSFRDLLLASAKSPAMLRYLNNASSKKDAPNQNYARELLELHTLGVGNYSEDDVNEVARAFTGWSLRTNWPGSFFFDSREHDDNEKVVLGQRMAAKRGIEDGLQVLDLLANHPATAKHISFKLCRRFVQDDPPAELVESTTQVFLSTQGDIKAVLKHIFTSEGFGLSAGQKYRRPMELVVATVRVLQPSFNLLKPKVLFDRLDPMGQIPFMWHPPNGYPDVAAAWMNTNGTLNRWNLAMLFAQAGQEGVKDAEFDLDQFIAANDAETVGSLIDRLSRRLLGGTLHIEDKEQLVFFLSDFADEAQLVDKPLRDERLATLTGLLLASPYFQWT